MSSPRILVAEDDPATKELVLMYLESRGYEVAAVLNVNNALDMASTGEFNLLIFDIDPPLYGVVQVLQMLREWRLSHRIKIIALTADTRWALRDEIKRHGVDSYLIKPVSLAQLGAEVTRLLIQPPPREDAPPWR
jgi:two-component system OmpR family response regulator